MKSLDERSTVGRPNRAETRITALIRTALAVGEDVGGVAFAGLVRWVVEAPYCTHFEISLLGVHQMDAAFARASIVRLAQRFKGRRGFTVTGISNSTLIDVLDAAASEGGAPIAVREGDYLRLAGTEPSECHRETFEFALTRECFNVREYASSVTGLKLATASKRIQNLLNQGLLIRHRSSRSSRHRGFRYSAIG